ncbi:hypothetical protein [Burkholderia gladioli]|uniref:hypothetical protein n=1 Tax=Burkholderia gladioli TaxID=28095 RepID=UPI001C2770FF|nr:hypothetical protein [Burkholderia gladioli]MBU9379369.1 hypothetical protein [Burkholderia gladioli]
MKDGSGQAYLIGSALKQRRYASRFTGGPFSGSETSCEFVPSENPDGSLNYQCYATRFLQSKDRICGQGLDWATYRTYASRSEADIVDGTPKLAATCNDNDSCYDDDDPPGAKAGWNLHPDAKSPVTYDRSLPQLDAEAMISMMNDEPAWLNACLTNRRYPAASPAQ